MNKKEFIDLLKTYFTNETLDKYFPANDFRIMTIPKIGYKHINMRENSLFWDYKNDSKQRITPEEAAFWVEQAKKEYFFTYDRAIKYEN